MSTLWEISSGDSDASVAFALTKMIILAQRDAKRDWQEAEILALFDTCLKRVKNGPQAKETKAKGS
jgi:hypothetical protein